MTRLSEVDGLTAADVMHQRLSSLPASVTVGEVREYFAASASRQLALIVDGERYVGSIPASAIPDELDANAAAAGYATRGPTIDPQASAADARDLALADPSRRLPVVDAAGTLVGIVAIDKQLERFCGA
jgi:CBS domain-containing protein